MLQNETPPQRQPQRPPIILDSEVEEDDVAPVEITPKTVHKSTADDFGNDRKQLNDFDFDSFINDPLGDALRLISGALNMGDRPALTLETLQAYILKSESWESEKGPAYPRAQLVHRVLRHINGQTTQTMYLDQPMWLEGENSSRAVLAGNIPLSSISSYLSEYPEVCCILYEDYDMASYAEEYSGNEDWSIQVKPRHTAEVVQLITASLQTAVAQFLKYYGFNTEGAVPMPSDLFPILRTAIYHTRGDTLTTFLKTLEEEQHVQFQVLLDAIIDQYEDEYNLVDQMTQKGIITQAYVKYLFKPGDIIVQGQDQNTRGYLGKSLLEENKGSQDSDELQLKTFSVRVWSWDFDGEFSREVSTLKLEFDATDCSDKKIDELSIRPLRYANESTKTRLKTRGEWVWKCRVRHMVSYDDTPKVLQQSSDERYMVDMAIYRELHRSGLGKINPDWQHRVSYLGPQEMKQEHPPDEDFFFLAPLRIKAYNLKRKKWVDLHLDGLREISWNTKAFESLVLNKKTKRLIQALISNQIETGKSTDLISGKGNGLIMLLHGGPGTGKTLTAESVAEIAKKPLYPVTCGDIGTKPEDVDRYLESVLYLGKIWGCVVLLDEADVFLEQRSLEDLQRNALVSVFLRVLEYYDGILILTSNRVGTFDEAFKSRIQLAVHYRNLTTHQRTKIWENFISRLRELNEEGIDFDDLEDNIELLASREMNGREIRNAITTARQYARWERQQDQGFKLNHEVMKEVIETAGEFDEYINTLNGGLTQEQLAKEDGIR